MGLTPRSRGAGTPRLSRQHRIFCGSDEQRNQVYHLLCRDNTLVHSLGMSFLNGVDSRSIIVFPDTPEAVQSNSAVHEHEQFDVYASR